MRVEFAAAPEVRHVLDRLGRTEDLHFSPSGRRLALAGFAGNRILVLEVEIAASRSGTSVTLTGSIEVGSPGLCEPHGVFFLDEDTLVVANRAGGVTALKIPPGGPGSRTLVAPALESMRASKWLHSPGSVSATPIGRDRYALLVCNNYANYVSRHVVGLSRELDVETNEILLSHGLSTPDGVAVDRHNRWIAVSNHGGRSVLLYENTPQLNLCSQADGVLAHVACPHGVRFSSDDEFVFVADAGAPFVHVYAKDGDSWRGERSPIVSFRVMDDATFARGRYNPTEGGPKGIDFDRDMSVLATTCEHQPLAFFDLPAILGQRRKARCRCGVASRRALPLRERKALQALLWPARARRPDQVVRLGHGRGAERAAIGLAASGRDALPGRASPAAGAPGCAAHAWRGLPLSCPRPGSVGPHPEGRRTHALGYAGRPAQLWACLRLPHAGPGHGPDRQIAARVRSLARGASTA